MVNKTGKRKVNRTLRILLVPASIIIFALGLWMFRLGQQKSNPKGKAKPVKKENVTLIAVPLEEQVELTAE